MATVNFQTVVIVRLKAREDQYSHVWKCGDCMVIYLSLMPGNDAGETETDRFKINVQNSIKPQ